MAVSCSARSSPRCANEPLLDACSSCSSALIALPLALRTASMPSQLSRSASPSAASPPSWSSAVRRPVSPFTLRPTSARIRSQRSGEPVALASGASRRASSVRNAVGNEDISLQGSAGHGRRVDDPVPAGVGGTDLAGNLLAACRGAPSGERALGRALDRRDRVRLLRDQLALVVRDTPAVADVCGRAFEGGRDAGVGVLAGVLEACLAR